MFTRTASLILFLFISRVSAAQQSFPQNLFSSLEYHSELVLIESAKPTGQIDSLWSRNFPVNLSRSESQALARVIDLATYQAGQLTGETREFYLSKKHVAIYLSGLNPTSVSEFDRVGVWQLSFPDALRSGLRVTEHLDERRDLEMSTMAALDYFRRLESHFGSEADLAFVMGPAAYVKAGSDIKEEISRVLDIIDQITERQNPVTVTERKDWVAQNFTSGLSIKILLERIKLPEKSFRALNPTLIGSQIPQGLNRSVYVPELVDENQIAIETKEFYLQKSVERDSAIAKIKKKVAQPSGRRLVYKVQSGDVLGRIADHFGVKVSDIKRWNKLRSNMIRIGQKLVIYHSESKPTPSMTIAKSTPKKTTTSAGGTLTSGYFVYEVKAGDTLWRISQKYEGVSPEDIMRWNGIDENLDIGQKLKIKKSP